MPKKKRKRRVERGRPPKSTGIDWEVVDEWIKGHMTQVGIAANLGMSPDTFADAILKEKGTIFTYYSQDKRAAGKSNIQYKQYTEAMEGNTAVLLRLGDVWLGQDKKTEDEIPTHTTNDIAMQNAALQVKNAEYEKRIAELEAKLNDSQPKASPIDNPSDTQV